MGKKSYPSHFICTQGRIIDSIDQAAFRALLPNGKETIAFAEKKNASLRPNITPGAVVALRISPADFNYARIDGIITAAPL